MYIRKWLNPQGRAFIEVMTEDSGSGDVTIADCDRKITLDFNFWGNTPKESKKRKQQKLKKLNIIIDILHQLKLEMEK